MKILIFEGIATSGKSTIIEQSKLSYTAFDTTNHEYGTITEDILKLIRQQTGYSHTLDQ